MKKYTSLAMLILTAWLFGHALPSRADPVAEYEMKAAYLYNFVNFTTWPESSPATVKLCVLGKDSFRGSLEKLTRKNNANLRIQLNYIADAKSADHCHLLFIDSSEGSNAATIIPKLEKMPILTVTDSPEVFDTGGMIGLFMDGQRLTFDVNYAKTQASNLVISSKLLRVARKVSQ